MAKRSKRRTLTINQIAVRTARARSKSLTPTSAAGFCLREVRECFGVAAKAPNAATAWHDAKFKHRAPTNPAELDKFLRSIPRGVPVWWTGGSKGFGHVGISTGFLSRCYSTDILRVGWFDRTPIRYIAEKWGMRFVGWSEDINGVRVYKP